MITYLNKFGDEIMPIDFVELQWNRKYHESGNFVLYMAAKDYNPDIKYIQVKDRPETGIVQKIVYEEKTNGDFVTLSGFFIEKLLDCTAPTEYRISNAAGSTDPAPDAINDSLRWFFYNYFIQQTNNLKNSINSTVLGVRDGKAVVFFFETLVKDGVGIPRAVISFDVGEPFGKSLYKNLEKYNCSYIVRPLFKNRDENKPLLSIETQIWKGRDLRNSVYFGDSIDNVKKIEFMVDESGAKECVIGLQEIPDEITNYSNVFSAYEDGKYKKFISEVYHYQNNMPTSLGKVFPQKIIKTNCNEINASNEKTVRETMQHEAKLELLNNYIDEKISIDVIQNKFYYLKDYDLGDVCTIVIDKIQKMYTARIVEINEVFSQNKNDVELILGTPTKQEYRRII
jgi:hypothetical protein